MLTDTAMLVHTNDTKHDAFIHFTLRLATGLDLLYTALDGANRERVKRIVSPG